MSVQLLTVTNTVPEAVSTASKAVPEAVRKPSGTKPGPFSLPWMQDLVPKVRKKLVEFGIKFQRDNYLDNKEIIRKIIFEVGGIKTWAKSRAWKKYDLKKFYSKFVVNYTIGSKVRGIVPLKLPKTPSGKFNKEAFRIVEKKLRFSACKKEKNVKAFRRNALKMFGLKKWDRSKFQGKLTFSKFLKNYVLYKLDINICRRQGDFNGEPRNVLPLSSFINFDKLIRYNLIVPNLSDEDDCSLCQESIDPSDLNKIFVSACNHKFHYDCVRAGYEYLFVNGSRTFKCPNCRQHSNIERVLPNDDMYYQQDDMYY